MEDREILEKYRNEVSGELRNILSYWSVQCLDEKNGGFIGAIDNNNVHHWDAPKGVVLNSRILWTFAAAYNNGENEADLLMASRAYEYIRDHFVDRQYGGVYWSVTYNGKPLDTKKQVYAQSFCMYGLSEYYLATQNTEALDLAIDIYRQTVRHGYEPAFGGYIEAFTREWGAIADLRLSEKDANERKTMNTHLHVIEGFANLYRAWPDVELKEKIVGLLDIFEKHIIDSGTFHLKLFFNDQWQEQGRVISYGHDIEAAWLLLECAEIAGEERWIGKMKERAVQITSAAAEGLDADGGMWHEYDVMQDHLLKQKHWWPQAEAMVGFFNAWQLTQEPQLLQQSLKSWKFIKQYLIDVNHGEWYWGVNADYSKMQGEDKAGTWKCPYHNGRACMEIMKRIKRISVEVV